MRMENAMPTQAWLFSAASERWNQWSAPAGGLEIPIASMDSRYYGPPSVFMPPLPGGVPPLPAPPLDMPPLDMPPLDMPPLLAPPFDVPPLAAPPLDMPPLPAPPLARPPLDMPPPMEEAPPLPPPPPAAAPPALTMPPAPARPPLPAAPAIPAAPPAIPTACTGSAARNHRFCVLPGVGRAHAPGCVGGLPGDIAQVTRALVLHAHQAERTILDAVTRPTGCRGVVPRAAGAQETKGHQDCARPDRRQKTHQLKLPAWAGRFPPRFTADASLLESEKDFALFDGLPFTDRD